VLAGPAATSVTDDPEQGKSGVLVDDARDLRAFGDAVVGLLQDEPLGRRLGVEARHRVVRTFISPCHLIEQARLVVDLVS
jgi:glycosyltransferase involved in cell wall biosynthesis